MCGIDDRYKFVDFYDVIGTYGQLCDIMKCMLARICVDYFSRPGIREYFLALIYTTLFGDINRVAATGTNRQRREDNQTEQNDNWNELFQ